MEKSSVTNNTECNWNPSKNFNGLIFCINNIEENEEIKMHNHNYKQRISEIWSHTDRWGKSNSIAHLGLHQRRPMHKLSCKESLNEV